MTRALLPTFATPDGPEPARAAGLASAVLRAGKARCWDELGGALPDGIVLSPEQVALLQRHAGLVRLLRRALPGEGGSSVSVAVCGSCGRWLLLTGSAPARCPLTRGCGGDMVKSRLAARAA